jgi:membrane associated rhomboid family serine protease
MPSNDEPSAAEPEGRQAVFNAPFLAVLVAGVILLSFPLQEHFLSDEEVGALAVSGIALAQGRGVTLFTSLFLHQGWVHVLMNAAFALAFGAPVARALGPGVRGGLAFVGFYLACGALSGECFALLHWGSAVGAIGASGAVSGLMGGAARLMDRPGTLSPILGPSVIRLGAGWLAVNLLLAVVGFAPGLGGAGIAWQAHLAGFAAGVLLVGAAVRFARPT